MKQQLRIPNEISCFDCKNLLGWANTGRSPCWALDVYVVQSGPCCAGASHEARWWVCRLRAEAEADQQTICEGHQITSERCSCNHCSAELNSAPGSTGCWHYPWDRNKSSNQGENHSSSPSLVCNVVQVSLDCRALCGGTITYMLWSSMKLGICFNFSKRCCTWGQKLLLCGGGLGKKKQIYVGAVLPCFGHSSISDE